jgi:signal peptidase complex subunit 2
VQYLSRPNLFKQIHLHTDVRLTLGWAGVVVASATGLYGWKVDFEQSKALQALYAYFVEADIVFVGRRKTFSKRIITERITISSRTLPVSASSSEPSPANAPSYSLNMTYVQSTSGGKSLLAKHRGQGSKEYSGFFDEKGVMVQEVFETWVGQLVESTMEGKSA